MSSATYERSLKFDQHQFFRRANKVSKASQLSFQDAEATHVLVRSTNASKQTPTPRWAVDKVLLQQVILNFLERRYYIKSPTGTPAERLAAVREKSVQRIAGLKSSPEVVAAVVYHFYLLNQNSIEVAGELGLNPPHVRQLISRLHQAWWRLSGERPASRYDAGGTCAGMAVRWTPDKLKILFLLRSTGKTFEQIGKAFGVSQRAAQQTYQRHFLRDFRPATPTGRRVRLSRIQREDGSLTLRYENLA